MADTAVGTSGWLDTLLGIAGIASSLYGAGKGSGSTPNFYPLPTTPEEKTASDSKVNLYNYMSQYVDQFLRGLNGQNPDWAPTSPLLGPNGGGGFMGGLHLPQIDWSKMPSAPHVNPSGSGNNDTKGGLPGGGTNAGNPDQNIPGPANPGQDPFANWPQNPDAANVTWDDIKGAFGSDGVKIGMGILSQNPGATLMAIFNFLRNYTTQNGKLPDSNMDWSKIDFTPGKDGLPDSNLDWSKIDLTPGNTPPGQQPPPPSGTNTGDYPLGIYKTPPDQRVVTVGGNLGDPGKPPPGWTLDNPYGWVNDYYGVGGGSNAMDPWSGTGPGRKPHF